MWNTSYPAKKINFLEEILAEFGSDMLSTIANLRARVDVRPVDFRLNLQVLLNAFGDEAAAFAISDELPNQTF